MTLETVEVGFVSADRALVDFYAAVFELGELEAMEFPVGTLYRLDGPSGIVKVLVPASPPAMVTPAERFDAVAGLRYLTLRVDDFDGVLDRATTRGAQIVTGPLELAPGVRIAVLRDPDGNALEVAELP